MDHALDERFGQGKMTGTTEDMLGLLNQLLGR